MRSNLRKILSVAVAAGLMINPAMACDYWGCGEVYVSPCGGCGGPCDAVEVAPADSCCTMGEPSEGSPMGGPRKLPAPEPPAQPSGNMGGEMLVPPDVPPTHAGKPLKFEEPPAEPEPAPPTEGADDLFGTPAAEPSEGGDLFGPSAPAEEESVEVIEEETTEPAEEGGLDSLFGAPAEEPAEQPAEEGGLDSLFGTPAEEESTQPAAPAEEAQPAEEKEEEDSSFDDLFGQADAVLQEAGGLASTGMRRWVDDTGEYSCHGRLIDVRDGHAKLLKDNGRTSTVPLTRLSKADLDFVHRQASAQQTASSDRTVRLAPSWPTN